MILPAVPLLLQTGDAPSRDFHARTNAPEIAILGVGGIVLKPKRSESGEVTYADYLPLSLTIDHQAIDGASAARFLQTLVSHLENNPANLCHNPTNNTKYEV